jgi:hypothetical protein
MKTHKVWVGRKGAKNGCDDSDFQLVEFSGTELGWLRISDDPIWDDHGTDYRIFQTEDNTILIHRVRWSRWQGEDTFADVLEYSSLAEAAKAGWRRVLENAGVIPRRVRSLREWRAERERQQREAD